MGSEGTFNANDHVKNIKTQGAVASASYTVESQTVFGRGGDAVLDNDGKVIKPGIAKVKVTVGKSTKEAYIIADINGILNAVFADAAYSAAYSAAYDADAYAGRVSANAAAIAAAANAATAVANAYDAYAAAVFASSAYAVANASRAAKAANAVKVAASANSSAISDAESYDSWCGVYKTKVDGVVSEIVSNYKTATAGEQSKKDWLNAAYAAVKVTKKLSDGKVVDLEVKLKITHMACRIAQFVWLHNTTSGDKDANANACKIKGGVLQEVIDSVYSDKVGDIEEQAAAQA